MKAVIQASKPSEIVYVVQLCGTVKEFEQLLEAQDKGTYATLRLRSSLMDLINHANQSHAKTIDEPAPIQGSTA